MKCIQYNTECIDYMANFFNGAKTVSASLMNKEKVYIGFESEKGAYALPSLLIDKLVKLINVYGINDENHKIICDFYDRTLKTIAEQRYPQQKYKHSTWAGKVEIYQKTDELISPIKNRYFVTKE